MNGKIVFRSGLSALAVAVLAISCVRSLQPLFEDDDLVFDARLVGTWTDNDGEDAWTFERGDGKEYTLTCRTSEDEAPARFRGRLGKLGGAFFLDLYPDKGNSVKPRNDLFAMHLVPAHTFWRVRFEGGLCLDPFNQDWLKEGIRAGKIKIGHIETEEEMLLTADTGDLQKFLAGLAADGDAFPHSNEPLRKR